MSPVGCYAVCMSRRSRLRALIRRRLGRAPSSRHTPERAESPRTEHEPEEAAAPQLPPGHALAQAEALAESPSAAHVRLADLEILRGVLRPAGRPLLVNHWATWCEGCVEELPDLVELVQAHAGAIDAVGISWELFSSSRPGAVQRVEAVARRHGLAWPSWIFDGEPEELFEGLSLTDRLIPQTTLFGPGGKRRFHHVGALDATALRELDRRIRGGA